MVPLVCTSKYEYPYLGEYYYSYIANVVLLVEGDVACKEQSEQARIRTYLPYALKRRRHATRGMRGVPAVSVPELRAAKWQATLVV